MKLYSENGGGGFLNSSRDPEKVGGHIHVPAALISGKETPVSGAYEVNRPELGGTYLFTYSMV
jgi:hypothetical protein